MLTHAEVYNKLSTLGQSSNAIYNSLRSLGIKGKRGSTCDCPIANYLKSLGAAYVEVNSLSITVELTYGIRGITMSTDGVIAEFLSDFDTEQFPQLDVENSFFKKEKVNDEY